MHVAGEEAAWRWWKGAKEEGLTMATAAAAALEAGPVCVHGRRRVIESKERGKAVVKSCPPSVSPRRHFSLTPLFALSLGQKNE